MNLYVRVKPKSGVEKFYRCAILFTLAWTLLEGIDAATAQRLEEEQMLEVSIDRPDGYESAEAAAQPKETDLSGDAVGDERQPAADTPAAAPNAPPAEKEAPPVDPVVNTDEGVNAVQAQAEAEAKAQTELEAAADAAKPKAPAKTPVKAK